MSELERTLAGLAAEIEWPDTPALELRLDPVAARPRRRRRWLVVAIAVALVAIGIAFAVPPARSAILDFFHIGGVSVERVDTLPFAEQRPFTVGLGEPVSREAAEAVLGGPFAFPSSVDEAQLYERDGIVSTVLATPTPVLLSEFSQFGSGSIVKKTTAGAIVEHMRIDAGAEGLWIAGEQHIVMWPQAPPRLAGNVLVWERDGVTYRLEGKALTKERAVELARELAG
jgi:hypothetical protein